MVRRLLPLSFPLVFGACYAMMPLEDYASREDRDPYTAPPPGQGLIYVAAESSGGQASALEVFVDAQKKGNLAHKNYLNFAVAPGRHKVNVFHRDAPFSDRLRRNSAPTTFSVEAGKSYYMFAEWKQYKKGGGVFGGAVGELEGRALVAKSRPGIYTTKPLSRAPLRPMLAEPRSPPKMSPAPTAAPALAFRSDIDTPGYSSKPRPDDFAIVIGIDGYKNLPGAPFAERDAETVRSHLLAMGLPKRHVVVLKGDAATGNGMRKYIEEWLPRNVKPASTVFFYYSGHGAPDVETGKAYLVPWDGDAVFLKSTAYPLEKLYASLNRLEAGQVIVALDACFSGAGGRSVLAKGARPLVTKVDQSVPQSGKIAVFTAASESEITTTLEDEGHGIFTYFLLKGLGGAAQDARGRVTVQNLYRYLKPKVQDEARLQNREQTPQLMGDAGDVRLR